MDRRRSSTFRQYWHDRQLELDDGRLLRWTLIDDAQHPTPHAECFRWRDGAGVHLNEARRILAEARHPDARRAAAGRGCPVRR